MTITRDRPITGPADVTRLGTILGVWAHPDDETYLSAGVMATATGHGQRVVVLSATDGELGTAEPATWPPERLARTRRWEAAAAFATLGVTEHRRLGYADGSLCDVDLADGAAAVRQAIDEIRPDTILTFGPDGMTGHPDHRAVSAWVDAAVRNLDEPPTVLHATIEADHGRRWAYLNDEYDLMLEPDLPPLGERDELALFLDLGDDALDRKLVALRAMATQTAGVIDAFGIDVYRPWVSTEAFVLAPVSL